jgi:hypothetical protein
MIASCVIELESGERKQFHIAPHMTAERKPPRKTSRSLDRQQHIDLLRESACNAQANPEQNRSRSRGACRDEPSGRSTG